MFEAPEFQTELSDPFGSRRSEWIFPEGELSPSPEFREKESGQGHFYRAGSGLPLVSSL